VSSTFVDRPITLVSSGRSGKEAHGIAQVPLAHSRLVSISSELVLATTWSGYCLVIEVESGRAEMQPYVGHSGSGEMLQSPVARSRGRQVCAVATRAAWAAVWAIGDYEARRIFADHGTVNAVALSADCSLLAIGTGYYPLGPAYPKCALEIWSLVGTPRRLAMARLPDVVIDQIWWDEDCELILVCSGEISQDRGHLWIFDSNSLELCDSAPIDYCMVRAGALVRGGDWVLTAARDRLERRQRGELYPIGKQWILSGSADTAAISDETSEVFFPDGQLIDFRTGEVGSLPPLPDCAGVAARPGGGFVGLSRSGMLRVWDRSDASGSPRQSQ
jgi:hypothetical protein